MPLVEIQLWGPVTESCYIGYDWITVGTMEYPEDKDFDFIREKIKDVVSASEYKPFVNAARIKFPTGTKVTLTEVW